MKSHLVRKKLHSSWMLPLGLLAGNALAQDAAPAEPLAANKISLSVSPYVQHFNLEKDYEKVWLVGLEREHPDGRLDGIAVFRNSFAQPCLYFFPFGKVYHGILGVEPLSFKWTAGLLYGYVGEYQDRVPLNYKGFSPGVNVALAWQFSPEWSGQMTLAGSFLMFQLNLRLK